MVAEQYYQTLTTSPVVYIMVFEQTDGMRKNHWLGKILEAKTDSRGRTAYKPYDCRYVVYVGETNSIKRRTNQHLIPRQGHEYEYWQLNPGNDSDQLYDVYIDDIRELNKVDAVLQSALAEGRCIDQYVIWDTYFTKSMTLDLENKFIDYLHAIDDVYTLNGRGNPQMNYYMSYEKDAVGSSIWKTLSLDNPQIFPNEQDIWNSELYKVSPFHALGKQQSATVNDICAAVGRILDGMPACGETLAHTTSDHRLIVVEGASGTGKSIVLSTLFIRLSSMLQEKSEISDYGLRPNNKVCLIVNQDQQLTLYSNLANKLGLIRNKKDDACIFKATPFLNAIDSGEREQPDVVLIDEAHLLRMSNERFNYNKKSKKARPGCTTGFHGNQLYDILLRTKIVVAVFDPVQVMRKFQQWNQEVVDKIVVAHDDAEDGHLKYNGVVELQNNGNTTPGRDTFNTYHVELTEQFRIDASQEVIDWIDRLADLDAVGFGPIPEDTTIRNPPQGVHGEKPYDIRVFSSPKDLAAAIEHRRQEIKEATEKNKGADSSARFSAPLCRVLATYDWAYDKGSNWGTVELYKVRQSDGCYRWEMPIESKAPAKFDGSEDDVFSMPWNYTKSGTKGEQTWAADTNADAEVGSYFSVQGFDLNYAGVIIGPSITLRGGKIAVDKSKSVDTEASGAYAETLILQQLKVLIRRGIHGLYLFAVDPELQQALETAAKSSAASGAWVPERDC